MWDRVLIANRGEIAVRIARTVHRLGMSPVGVYASPDTQAYHPRVMDQAVLLPGNTLSETYLSMAAIIEAARSTGCQAVHPGYGFLSENPQAAEAILQAGLIWVGPTPEQIRQLGDKLAVKRLAAELGVPTSSPLEVDLSSPLPTDLSFPVLVKAAGGGGGRGMVVVRTEKELPAAIRQAANRAQTDFGDPRVFLEPRLENGRHIEVQILGDQHGQVVHLGERDCSLQRRRQKIVEESPAPNLAQETRAKLWEGALRLAQAVEYQSAGTVEFMVGVDGRIDLLEVNTRLQVEHPVTEAVTGMDLVEWQFRVAAGEHLPFTQENIKFSGHAVETRLVAEDPAQNWLPMTGQMDRFDWDSGIRLDTGIQSGDIVTEYYDSLLAKLIAHRPTREEAFRVLRRALRTAHLSGVTTNRDLLVSLLADTDLLAGLISTSLLEEKTPSLVGIAMEQDSYQRLLLAAVVANQIRNRQADQHWGFVVPRWRNLPTQGHRSRWTDSQDGEVWVEEEWQDPSAATIWLGPWPEPDPKDGALIPTERQRLSLRILRLEEEQMTLEVDGIQETIRYSGTPETGLTTTGSAGGLTWTLTPSFTSHQADGTSGGPRAPLPGTVLSVPVQTGQTVDAGDLLMVIEAMKMEHRITASALARVQQIHYQVGDRVDVGDLLVELAETD